MYIISQPGTKVRITICTAKDAHGLRRRSPSLQEGSRTEGVGTSRPAPRDKLDLRWMAPLQSKLQNLNMQVQGSQKLPNNYPGECQVTCRDKYMYVDITKTIINIKSYVECTCIVSMRWRHKMKVIRQE